MKVCEATVIDKNAGAEPISYESYVAVGTEYETSYFNRNRKLPKDFTDDDIHFYFHEDEFKPVNGRIETEEFKYLIGERVA